MSTNKSINNKRIENKEIDLLYISSKKRENWIDWSKTILIWLMVLGHAGLGGLPREFIYAFHMPAFFIISGYLYKPHNWFKTLKGFGIPILFFSVINLCYVVLKSEMQGESILNSSLIQRIIPPYWRCNYGDYISLFRGVWFVMVLFGMRLLMGDFPIFSFVRKYVTPIIFIMIAYMSFEYMFESLTHPLHEYYAYKVIGCMPLMMTGVILKNYRDKLMNLPAITLVIFFVSYVSITLLNGAIDIWAYLFGKHYLLFFIAAVAASIFMFNICKRLRPNSYIETFSKGTLLILGLHDPIIEICNKIYNVLNLPHLCVVTSLIVMIVCYYPIRWSIRHFPALLGK